MPTQFSFAGREIRPLLSRKLHFHGLFRDQLLWPTRPSAVLVPVTGNLRRPISGARANKCHELHPTLLVKKDWTIENNTFDGAVIDFRRKRYTSLQPRT
jgi:hypothetical protein